MTASDWLLTFAALGFALAWWLRSMPARPVILLIAAVALLASSIWGVLIDRWQAAAAGVVAVVFLATLLINRLRKTDVRSGAPLVSGAVFTALAGGAIALIQLFPVWGLPDPTGEHPVGVREFEMVDASRPGVLAAKPDEPRRLLVRVWYPAGDIEGLEPRRYFSKRESETTARSLGGLFGFPQFFAYVRHVATNSYENAPLLPDAKDLPVVIYSHGYTSFLSQNTALMEELASHGYVVYSLQHTYDSSNTLFPNGDVAPMDRVLSEMVETEPSKLQQAAIGGATLDARINGHIDYRMEAIAKKDRVITQSAHIWIDDRLFLHDQLQAGAVPAEIAPIVAAGNLGRVGEAGMSFGGATSGTLCMIDPRCAAGVNMDGGDFQFASFNADEPVPFLMFHSDMANIYRQVQATLPETPRGFNEFSYESIAAADKRADVYRVQLKGAKHLGISDFLLFVRQPVAGLIFGTTPADMAIRAQNDIIRGFFDRHLKGQENNFPQAQMDALDGWVMPADNADIAQWWNSKSEAERAALEARIEAARAASPFPSRR